MTAEAVGVMDKPPQCLAVCVRLKSVAQSKGERSDTWHRPCTDFHGLHPAFVVATPAYHAPLSLHLFSLSYFVLCELVNAFQLSRTQHLACTRNYATTPNVTQQQSRPLVHIIPTKGARCSCSMASPLSP